MRLLLVFSSWNLCPTDLSVTSVKVCFTVCDYTPSQVLPLLLLFLKCRRSKRTSATANRGPNVLLYEDQDKAFKMIIKLLVKVVQGRRVDYQFIQCG